MGTISTAVAAAQDLIYPEIRGGDEDGAKFESALNFCNAIPHCIIVNCANFSFNRGQQQKLPRHKKTIKMPFTLLFTAIIVLIHSCFVVGSLLRVRWALFRFQPFPWQSISTIECPCP